MAIKKFIQTILSFVKSDNFIKWFLIPIILIIFFLLNTSSALKESQTTDEGVHILAGYSYWQTHDIKINPEHPPLLKYFATLPLNFIKLHFAPLPSVLQEEDQWQLARNFLYLSGNNADLIIFLSRLPIILLSVFLGFFIFWWAKKLFGVKTGLIALILYAFDANFLSHGHYLTTDLGLALGMLVSVYYFNKYLEKPKLLSLALLAFFTSLSLLTKFSAFLLLPLFVIIFLAKRWHSRDKTIGLKKLVVIFLAIGAVFILLALALYGLDIKQPISDPWVQNYIQKGTLSADLKILSWPIPLYDFFKGLIMVQQHSQYGHYSYLLGEFDIHGGWWYYFPVVFLVKTALAVLAVFVIALAIYIKKLFCRRPRHWRSIPFIYFLLALPPVFYFLVSLNSNLNIGVRHLLPIYPFLFILAAVAVTKIKFNKKSFQIIFKTIISLLLAFYIVNAFLIWPHYLSYFSEAIGGSKNGYKYVSDSNLDWGQDLKNLKNYLEKNNIEKIYTKVSGWAGPAYYGITSENLPENQITKGYIAISISYLMQENNAYSWLWQYQPIDNIGYSIYIYKID